MKGTGKKCLISFFYFWFVLCSLQSTQKRIGIIKITKPLSASIYIYIHATRLFSISIVNMFSFCVHCKQKKPRIKKKVRGFTKPSLGSREVPQKNGPDRFSRFDVYWIQTDRQTDNCKVYIQKVHVRVVEESEETASCSDLKKQLQIMQSMHAADHACCTSCAHNMQIYIAHCTLHTIA